MMIKLPLWILSCNPEIMKQSLFDEKQLQVAFDWYLTEKGFTYWSTKYYHGHTVQSKRTIEGMIDVIDHIGLKTSTRFIQDNIPMDMPIVISTNRISCELGYFDFIDYKMDERLIFMVLSFFGCISDRVRPLKHFQYESVLPVRETITLLFTENDTIVNGKIMRQR